MICVDSGGGGGGGAAVLHPQPCVCAISFLCRMCSWYPHTPRTLPPCTLPIPTSYRCSSIEQLKERLPQLRKELDDKNKFTQIYNYAYTFSREVCAHGEVYAGEGVH